jgi:hypothetical protein
MRIHERRQYLLFDSLWHIFGHLLISNVVAFLGPDSRITMHAFPRFLQQFAKRSLLRAVCIFCSRLSTPVTSLETRRTGGELHVTYLTFVCVESTDSRTTVVNPSTNNVAAARS